MENKFFIIGGGSLQVDFIKVVKNKGYLAYVFDYNPDCEGAKIADKFYCISIDAKEEILEIAKKEQPIAIHTVATEAGNVTACYVGEQLGLHTNTYETALNTTDKDKMKKVFEKFNIPSSKTFRLFKRSDISKYPVEYPFVVKASDRSAGRGVCLVNNYDEFEIAYEDAYYESNNKIVLVEEYIQGKQYSVETISQNGKHKILAVTEQFFKESEYFVEDHYLLPSLSEDLIINNYSNLFFLILNVFNIKFGASHIEFKIIDKEIKIIEIATRMGGIRDELILLAKGVDYLDIIINSITNEKIEIYHKVNNYSMAKWVFSKKDYLKIDEIKLINPKVTIDEKFDIRKITDITPKTLMDSQGIYYLQLQNREFIKPILECFER